MWGDKEAALRCGESSTAGGFPSAGDWRTRREVPSFVASGIDKEAEEEMTNAPYSIPISMTVKLGCNFFEGEKHD
ncbi:hypothetical protein [Calothrix sp. NIES-2098]|uniref:hypothetical protein n=1 Tax=Calothrix sp. NIES-2098 TaxID=1954171 RepID=UPI000B5EA31F|nr:hypothetical protein NIES2098_23670 [Calothrix sp. NIES-2098]